MTITPYAVVTFVLLAAILVATWPAGRARLRRYDLTRARRARRSEDVAWRRRREEADLAQSLRSSRYDQARSLGGHSVAVRERYVHEPIEGANLIAMDPATHRETTLGDHAVAVPRYVDVAPPVDPDTGLAISGWGIDYDRSQFALGLGEIDGGES